MALSPTSSRGGGTQTVLSATVTLNDAQIQALGTATGGFGPALVAAPAAGYALWCRGVLLTSHLVVPYTFTDDVLPALNAIYHDPDDNEMPATTRLSGAGISTLLGIGGGGIGNFYALLEPYFVPPDSSYDAVRANAISIKVTGATGPLIGGDPANTLTWHVLYAVEAVNP